MSFPFVTLALVTSIYIWERGAHDFKNLVSSQFQSPVTSIAAFGFWDAELVTQFNGLTIFKYFIDNLYTTKLDFKQLYLFN